MALWLGCTVPIDTPGLVAEGEGSEGEGSEGEGSEGEGGEGSEGERNTDLRISTHSIVPFFPQPADGVSATRLTVLLRDGGAIAAGVAMHVDSLPPGLVANAVTDGSGRATFSITSTAPAVFDIQVVTDDDSLVTHDPITLEFLVCHSLADEYASVVYPEVFQQCIGCHNEFGFAARERRQGGNAYVLPFPGEPGWAETSVQVLQSYVSMVGVDQQVAANALSDTFAPLVELADLGISVDDDTPIHRLVTNAAFGHTSASLVDPVQETTTFRRLASFVHRLRTTDTCGPANAEPFASISDQSVLSSPSEAFLAANRLFGEVPSRAAVDAVATEAMLTMAVTELVGSNAAQSFLLRHWNDWLLLRSVGVLFNIMPSNQLRRLYLSSSCNAPPANADDGFQCCRNDPTIAAEDSVRARICAERFKLADRGIREEPLQLLLDLYRSDRPFQEMLTADYTMHNRDLAESYGLLSPVDHRTLLAPNEGSFNDDETDDATEFRRVRVPSSGFGATTTANPSNLTPDHHGILALAATVNRFTTTVSNKRRGRASSLLMTRFLDVPVLRLAPISPPPPGGSDDVDAQIRYEQPCVVCHAVIDPVAVGLTAFDNKQTMFTRPRCAPAMPVGGLGYDEQGLVRRFLNPDDDVPGAVEDDGCPLDLLGRGVLDEAAPLRFDRVADRFANHPRLDVGVVVNLALAVFQQPRFYPPQRGELNFNAKALAFVTQERAIEDAVGVYRANGKSLRSAFVSLLLSPTFRAIAQPGANEDTIAAAELLGIGGHLSTPEALNARIQAVTGMLWTTNRTVAGVPVLTTPAQYPVLFGGIDSNGIVVRSNDVLPVRTNILRRLGNEVAYALVTQDFSYLDPTERRLFGGVELTDRPFVAGSEVSDEVSSSLIRAQMALLHEHLHGHVATDDDIEEAFGLFTDTLRLLDTEVIPTQCDDIISLCPQDHRCVSDRCQLDAARTLDYFDRHVFLGANSAVEDCPALGPSPSCVADEDCAPGPAPNRRITSCVAGQCQCDSSTRVSIRTDPHNTVRTWMAVLSFMLSDARFSLE
jgi:hypothetical protein